MSEYVPKVLGKVTKYPILSVTIGLYCIPDPVGFMVAKCTCYRAKPSRKRLCNHPHARKDIAGVSATMDLI